jgi:hypothetical protein
LNATPDEFVAVFGVAQEAPTAVESNQKVNARIEQFLSAADKLGVSRSNTYVDMITQNRVYNFAPANADGTIREKLTGFETKHTPLFILTNSIRDIRRPSLDQLNKAMNRERVWCTSAKAPLPI